MKNPAPQHPFYEDQSFLNREAGLLGKSIRNVAQVASPLARRHLREGFDRRLVMMQCSRILLRERAVSGREPPPSAYEIEELNVHLNSYYVNLRGSLDNLAWTLQYELSLLPGVVEDERKGRMDCNLFGSKFLNALASRTPELAATIRERCGWELELREMRDPAAHRLPICMVGGILFDDRKAEFDRLQRLAGAPEEELQGMSRSHYLLQAHNLLRYEPLLQVTTAKGMEARSVPHQVASDHEIFLSVAEAVFGHLWPGR